MARPGIMLYFDILGPIRLLPDDDKGRLLVAMLEYGQYGIAPEFNGALALAWEFVKPKLDKDEEAYKDSVVQREYAAFCKKRRRLNLPKIPFAEWIELPECEKERLATSDNEEQRAVDFVESRYPTTTTTTAATTTTPTTTTTTTAAATTTNDLAAAANDLELKFVGGELGKGVVVLSDAQIGSLLDVIGVDGFDYYVGKLANFIIKNDANVQNHYETILKWWREDGAGNASKGKTVKGASGKLGQAELAAIRRAMSEG